MNKRVNTLLLITGGLITTLIVYLAVRLLIADAALSIVPGWHTTIYPPETMWVLLTIVVLISSLLVYMIFRGTIRLLKKIRTRDNFDSRQ